MVWPLLRDTSCSCEAPPRNTPTTVVSMQGLYQPGKAKGPGQQATPVPFRVSVSCVTDPQE